MLPILFLLLIGVVLIFFDRERILPMLNEADWKFLPGALFFIACSNILVSYSYVVLARLMGIRMNGLKLAETFFVTTMMNRLIRSGGAAGLSVRYLIMKPYGVELNDVLNSSIIHFLLGSLLMTAMLPLEILYMVYFVSIPQGLRFPLIALAILGIIMAVGASSAVFSNGLRAAIARFSVWVTRKVARKDISAWVDEYASHAASAAQIIKASPTRFTAIMLLLIAEMLANMIVLGYCLKAFGADLNFGGVASIYVISILSGVLSMVPGGMGVQEGAITGLSVAQGVPFEQSVLAALLFRVVATIVPYLASLVFYPHLLKVNDASGENADTEIDSPGNFTPS